MSDERDNVQSDPAVVSEVVKAWHRWTLTRWGWGLFFGIQWNPLRAIRRAFVDGYAAGASGTRGRSEITADGGFVRYAITFKNHQGLRTVAWFVDDEAERTGRMMFDSREDAIGCLQELLTEPPRWIVGTYGAQAAGTFRVDEYECWPTNKDVKGDA
jgi:hypothetical protein